MIFNLATLPYAESLGRLSLRVHTLSGDLSDHHTGWGSLRSSFPVRRHAPALGAVRFSGAERWVRIQPAAFSSVLCLHTDVLHGAKTGSPGMTTAKVQRGLLEGSHRV